MLALPMLERSMKEKSLCRYVSVSMIGRNHLRLLTLIVERKCGEVANM